MSAEQKKFRANRQQLLDRLQVLRNCDEIPGNIQEVLQQIITFINLDQLEYNRIGHRIMVDRFLEFGFFARHDDSLRIMGQFLNSVSHTRSSIGTLGNATVLDTQRMGNALQNYVIPWLLKCRDTDNEQTSDLRALYYIPCVVGSYVKKNTLDQDEIQTLYMCICQFWKLPADAEPFKRHFKSFTLDEAMGTLLSQSLQGTLPNPNDFFTRYYHHSPPGRDSDIVDPFQTWRNVGQFTMWLMATWILMTSGYTFC